MNCLRCGSKLSGYGGMNYECKASRCGLRVRREYEYTFLKIRRRCPFGYDLGGYRAGNWFEVPLGSLVVLEGKEEI